MLDDFAYDVPGAVDLRSFDTIDSRPGLLVIADHIDIRALGPIGQAAGVRLLGITPLDQASSRLDSQGACDTLLIFCPSASPMLERLLVQVETQAIQTGMSVVIVAGWHSVDLAYACLRNPHSQLLCDPDQVELAAALVAAVKGRPTYDSVHEMDHDGSRIQQLSDEIGRLARTLDALMQRKSGQPAFDAGQALADSAPLYARRLPAALTEESDAMDELSAITAAQVRDLLRARRIRSDFLPGDLFADPAWDMLLDLLASQLERDQVSVSSLCIAAGVPPTTALRWLRTLTDKGLVIRHADPHDGRRVFISLAQDTADALLRWFGASRPLLTAA